MQVLSVTSLDGYEMMPSLSPDGNEVAFAWNGDKDRSNVDVYVSIVGTPGVHRVTTHPAMDIFPRWSPDGRQIAFVREWTDHAGRMYVVSPLGGPERKLSDFDAHFDRVAVFGDLSWSPDSSYVAVARSSTQPAGESTGIYLIPVQGGEPRLVTQAKAPASDRDPAISHDGRRLAYFSCDNCCWGCCDVMTVELDAELRPIGAPRRLTSMSSQMEGLAWTRDGRSLVFRRPSGSLYHLWRVDVDGRNPPERIEVTGVGARRPSTVPSRDRLVYGRVTDDMDIYQVGPKGSVHALSRSSFPDFYPAFSPDGNRLRSVPRDPAICPVSGSFGRTAPNRGCSPVTCGGASSNRRGRQTAAPWRSCPVRMARTISGPSTWKAQIFGGSRVRPGMYVNPPGRWTVHRYTSARMTRRGCFDVEGEGHVSVNFRTLNIWRIPAAGGPAEQVTQSGGFKGVETADGKALVYQPRAGSERVSYFRHSSFEPIAATARPLRLRFLSGDQRRVTTTRAS